MTRGEKQHIFPFQENSDAIFNSALVHELAVLRPLAEPLLLQVRHDTPEYVEANRLLSFLQWFVPASPDPVPDNSILREFIGGSILENFHVWLEAPPGRPGLRDCEPGSSLSSRARSDIRGCTRHDATARERSPYGGECHSRGSHQDAGGDDQGHPGRDADDDRDWAGSAAGRW